MDFTSDNICGVSPEIWQALAAADAQETQSPYGFDDLSAMMNDAFSSLFGRPAYVFPISTGTACNALALSLLVDGGETVLCHDTAHIHKMEAGAPEFFTHGAKLVPLAGNEGKISLKALQDYIRYNGKSSLHTSPARALSLSQCTDLGTIYDLAAFNQLARAAKDNGLFVHVDGARFANAVASAPHAPHAWVQNIDILSFGTSKNGTMNAEALVIFDEGLAQNALFKLKRSGHLLSKQRYLSAQLLAYLKDSLWLKNARKANHAASTLAQGLQAFDGVRLLHKVQTNMVFIEMDQDLASELQARGLVCYASPSESGEKVVLRLVCGFSTSIEKINDLLGLCRDCLMWDLAA